MQNRFLISDYNQLVHKKCHFLNKEMTVLD